MQTHLKRHEPLYLKHRPQSLDELVGQTAVTHTLTNAINYDRISHAYLFTGPRGTGKTSSARILAKSLNCKAGEKATVTPCQECASCLEIKNGTSPAVFEIDAASNNSVDDARVLIERAPLVAPGGRYKIYIIDECHMLTKEAFNALLKTIEDPPPNVVFVLATTEEHKVLPTIVSRCQRLIFRLVNQEDLLVHLRNVATSENISITDTALDFIARRSGGGLRDALGLLDQASLLATQDKPVDVSDLLSLLGALHEDVLLEMSEHVLHRRGHQLLGSAAKLLQEGREPAIVVQELARHFLNLTKASYLSGLPNAAEAAAEMIVASPSYLSGLQAQAPQFERSELSQLVEALDRLEQTCRRTTQPAMHLEAGLLSLCHRQDMLLVRELSERVARLEHALAGGAPLAHPPKASPAAATAPQAPVAHTAPTHAAPQAPVVHAAPAPAPQAAVAHAAPAPAPQAAVAHAAPAPAPQAAVAHAAPAPSVVPDVAPPAASVAVQEEAPPEPAAARVESVVITAQQAPAPQPAAPQPAPPAPAAPAAPAAASVDEDQASADEVDRVWSHTLDELQRRHIPTFSIAQQHAIPLSLTDREFVLGAKEMMVKTLETKLEHIKAACAAVVGKPIMVKVRPMALDVPAPKPAPKQQGRAPAPAAAPTDRPATARPADSDEDYEAGGHRSPPPQPEEDYDEEPRAAAPSPGDSPAKPTTNAAPSHAQSSERGNDGTILKEAYKLFEGPGSRQIGDKN